MKRISLLILIIFLTCQCYAQNPDWVLENGIDQNTISVTTTATALPTTALVGRKSMIVKNVSSATTVYLGDSDVTADTTATGGLQLKYGETFQIDLDEYTTLYGIVASSTASVNVFEAR